MATPQELYIKCIEKVIYTMQQFVNAKVNVQSDQLNR